MRCAPIALSSTRRWCGCCDGELAGEAAALIELGINHEQQHQELLLTDILALFAAKPLEPAYRQTRPGIAVGGTAPLDFVAVRGGIFAVGHEGDGFAYDNEGPPHQVLLHSFKLRRPPRHERRVDRLHRGRRLRHADALARRWLEHRQDARLWKARSIWSRAMAAGIQMSLQGLRPVDPAAPVTHVSYYEADAFARWAGYRLPTEFEWEVAAASVLVEGRTARQRPCCAPCPPGGGWGLQQMFGDVWEWTASAYLPYPGYKAARWRRRRIQRQVHVQSVRAARRLMRDARTAIPARPIAISSIPISAGSSSACAWPARRDGGRCLAPVAAGLASSG